MSTDNQEKELFNAALEQPTEERAAFLRGACQGDEGLHRRIEELLKVFEGSSKILADDASTLDHRASLTESTGTMIGRYKLLQGIGEGGMGVVYMAEQEEPIHRRVALKIIKLGMDTRQVVARFEAERQALAMMDHPNIAKVLDAGATDTGRPYFVMELVRGLKITEYCDQKKLATAERLMLFQQVCHAIQHAHQKGIIHRDIKPSNILITMHEDVSVPKVIDFGIAKATSDQRLTDKTLFTAVAQFIGTPAYMSPEQAGLSGLDIDTRSDIYSLGVLLYELLTGRTPFDAQELVAAGLEEMRRTIRQKEPVRPSTRLGLLKGEELTTTARRRGLEAPKLITMVRGDLDWIVMKCLEKDRTRRYETVNGLAADVKRHLSHEPVVARPPSHFYRFQKSVKRNKLAFAAATLVAASLIIGLGISTWMFFEEKQARQRAVAAEREEVRLRQEAQQALTKAQAEEQKARTEATKNQQTAQFLKDMLDGVSPSVALGRDTKLLKEILDKTAERIGKDLKDQPLVEADLRTTLGAVYGALVENERAEALLRPALELRKKTLGDDHRDVAASLDYLALNLLRQSQPALGALKETKLTEAESLEHEALTIRRKLFGDQSSEVAQSLDGLALIQLGRGKLAEAEPLMREALSLRKQNFGAENNAVAMSLLNLADTLTGQGKYAEAEPLYRDALAMRRKLFGKEHPDVAYALDHLADMLQRQRRFPEAEAVCREEWAMRRKTFGAEHLSLAYTAHRLADLLHDQGRLPEAEEMLRQAIAIRKKVLGADHRDVAISLDSLAMNLRKQSESVSAPLKESKLAEAESLVREALAIRTKLFGEQSPEVAQSLGSLLDLLQARSNGAQDEASLREMLTMRKQLLGNESLPVAVSLLNVADALTAKANYVEAEPFYRDALAIRRKLLGKEHSDVANVLENLARVLFDQGKLNEAESTYRELLSLRRKLFGSEHSAVANALHGFAYVLWDLRKLAEAVEVLREAVSTRKKLFGNEHRDVANALETLSAVLFDQGKLNEAESTYRELLAIRRKLFDDYHPDVAASLGGLVVVLLRQHKYHEAEQFIGEVLTPAVANQPDSAGLLLVRGDFHSQFGRFDQAASDFRRVIELRPEEHDAWFHLAPILARDAPLETYREHCRKSLERFGKAMDPVIAERTAKECLILPSSGVDLETIGKMVDLAVTAGSNHIAVTWFKCTKGLAEYRSGRFESAVEWVNKALPHTGHELNRDVEAYMTLAMANFRQGKKDEAQTALAKGVELVETKLPKLGSDDLSDNWFDWIIAHLLMREAKGLIEGKPLETSQSK